MSDYDDIISAPMAQAIEDAILFGHIKEIDAVLDRVELEHGFPDELRYGLQALRYFRAHYGKDAELEPTDRLQKQKVSIMENAWGAELIDMLRHGQDTHAARRAG